MLAMDEERLKKRRKRDRAKRAAETKANSWTVAFCCSSIISNALTLAFTQCQKFGYSNHALWGSANDWMHSLVVIITGLYSISI